MTTTCLLTVNIGTEAGSLLLFKSLFIIVFALIMYFSREKKSNNLEKPE